MKQKQNFLLIALLIGLGIVMSACTAVETDKGTETAVVPLAGSHIELIQESKAAYADGDFTKAITLAQQAINIVPSDQNAWAAYEQAMLAQSGSSYLTTLPDDRYRISTEDLLKDQADGKAFVLLDVREPDEFQETKITGAVNIPLRQLLDDPSALPDDKDAPIVVYCRSQKRSTHALVVLRQMGYTNVLNLRGGILAYQDYLAEHPEADPASNPELNAKPAPNQPSEPGDEYFGDDC